jgi:uncharacterized protein (DUF302 family)
MTYTKSSNRTPEQIELRLYEAAQRHKFGVLHVHDLEKTLQSKGIELGTQCRIYDVCNPQAAVKALHTEMKASAVLPCRISVFGQGAGSMIATVYPTDLLKATGISGVDELGREIEREIIAMIEEAA